VTIGVLAPSPALDRLVEIDRLLPGAVHRPTHVTEVAGGKACNAARSAAVLGTPIRMVTAAGGALGGWLIAELEGAGIRVDTVLTGQPLRICTSILDRSSSLLTEIYEPAPPLTRLQWDEMVHLTRRMSEAVDLVAVSGSLPSGTGAGALSGLLAGLPVQSVAGLRGVAVDCAGDALKAALGSSPGIVKINRAEALDLGLPEHASLAALAHGVTQMASGPCLVAVTGGVEGAVLREPSGQCWQGKPPTRGRYGVGCGDAFFGGLLTALAQGRTVRDSLTLALATAGANAETPGAGRFDPGRLPQLERDTIVEKVR